MSLSATISNAVSGLGAVARGIQVVSSNLANASTPGYAARELSLAPRSYLSGGGGVQINGVTRTLPQTLVAESRLATAELARSNQIFAFHSSMETLVGSINQTDSLHSLATDFGAALNLAVGSPDSNTYLHGVFDSAQQLTQKLNNISTGIQSARLTAEQSIAKDVATLNDSLSEIAKLNRNITIAQGKGQDTASLLDNRQSLIDSISGIVPLQEVSRANGQVALFTAGGAILLDGNSPAVIGFSPSPQITPHTSASEGHLSGLTFNGEGLDNRQQRMFQGGSLSAAFEIRDTIAPNLQNQIDTYAQDLYIRFSSDAVDHSLGPQDPGIFTDRQMANSPLNKTGLSERLQVSAIINPSAGGQLWKIRDGLHADQSTNVSDSSLLLKLVEAFDNKKIIDVPGFNNTLHSSPSFSSEIMSSIATGRLKSENARQIGIHYNDALKLSLSPYGVDSDKEIENLMQLEKLYAANAMVLQTANDMLDSILRIK